MQAVDEGSAEARVERCSGRTKEVVRREEMIGVVSARPASLLRIIVGGGRQDVTPIERPVTVGIYLVALNGPGRDCSEISEVVLG